MGGRSQKSSAVTHKDRGCRSSRKERLWQARSEVVRSLGAAPDGASSWGLGGRRTWHRGHLAKAVEGLQSSAPCTLRFPRREEMSLAFLTHVLSPAAHWLSFLLTQARFGKSGSDCPSKFCLFQSETRNLLFNDNTECLAKLQGKTTYEQYLGQEYVTAVTNLRRCSISRK